MAEREEGRPKRKRIRLKEYDYSQPGAYFVTVCARDRACVFGEIDNDTVLLTAAGKAVEEALIALPERFRALGIDSYAVMPNHVHAILFITEENTGAASSAPTLGRIMRAFKSLSAHSVRSSGGCSKSGLWQRSYYEHVVRTEADLNGIRQYILDNPLQWELDEENPQGRAHAPNRIGVRTM